MSWITTTSISYLYGYISQPGWNSGARTIASIPADGGYRFLAGQATGIVCGLNNVDLLSSYLEIDHGFFIEESRFRVMEQGVTKTAWLPYSKDQVFKIVRFLGTVYYYQDDVLIYTSESLSLGEVFLDCSLYSYLDSIIDVEVIDYSIESGGISQIEVSLLPLIALGTTEEDNYAFVDLLPLTASGTVTDVNTIDVSVLPLVALGVSGDLNFADIDLLPLVVLAEEISLVPDYNSIAIELRPLQTYGLQYDPDPALLDVELSPLTAFGADSDIQIIDAQLLPLTVETYLGADNYFSVEWPDWQVSIIQLLANAAVIINIPAPILLAKANDFDNMRVDVTIPAPILTMYTGGVIPLAVPALVMTATGTVQAVARAEIEVPAPELTATATNSTLASVNIVVPAPILTAATGAYASIEVLAPILAATAVSEGLIWVDLTVPAPEITASGTVGGVMSVVLEVPAPILTATGIVGAIAQVVLMVPAPILTASAQVSPGVGLPATTVATETTYTVNLTTGAVTTLLLGGLDRLITAHGRLYGLRSGELIRLDGDLDGSATIPATVRFAPQTFGSNRAKRLSTVYLNSREDDGLTLDMVADENVAWRYQTVTDTARAYGTHKVKVGRGVKFHTAGLVIQNRNGGRMDIGGMELLVDTGSPRPKT